MPKIKRTNEEWRGLLAAQRSSGQTQAEWCAANDVNLFTFRDRASRLKRLADEQITPAVQSETTPAGWLDVTPDKLPVESCCIRIERGGFTVTLKPGFSAEFLVDVLLVVKRVCY
jgi:hypothetical protein